MAIQTIYRELDRAKSLIKKETRTDGDSEFEDDWTFVDDDNDDDEVDSVPQYAVGEAITGMKQLSMDGTQAGSSSLALGSIVLKGASASASRRE